MPVRLEELGRLSRLRKMFQWQLAPARLRRPVRLYQVPGGGWQQGHETAARVKMRSAPA
jgi:hypothetical protein